MEKNNTDEMRHTLSLALTWAGIRAGSFLAEIAPYLPERFCVEAVR